MGLELLCGVSVLPPRDYINNAMLSLFLYIQWWKWPSFSGKTIGMVGVQGSCRKNKIITKKNGH